MMLESHATPLTGVLCRVCFGPLDSPSLITVAKIRFSRSQKYPTTCLSPELGWLSQVLPALELSLQWSE